jgi:hypothetical protein
MPTKETEATPHVWIVRDDETHAIEYVAMDARSAYAWIESYAPGECALTVMAFPIGEKINDAEATHA